MSANKELFYSKLDHVLALLQAHRSEFEKLNGDVEDQELKKILSQLIHLEEKHADQLIKNFSEDGHQFDIGNQQDSANGGTGPFKPSDMKALFNFCRSRKLAIEKIYREAIESCDSREKLKKLMSDQLNELKVLYLKIRIHYMVKSRLLNPYDLRKENPK